MQKASDEGCARPDSHLAPGGRRFDAAKPDEAPQLFRQTELRSKAFSSADFETRQVFVTSRDGTRVPMFIVARKGLTLSGDNPCLLYGYGGEPGHPPQILVWGWANARKPS